MSVDVGTATGYLDLDISGFLSGLKSAQDEAQKTTRSITDKIGIGFQGVGKALTSAGSTMTKGVTTPIVGLGTAIVKTSADFESSMSKVQAISGAQGKEFDDLASKAREMGASTKFSASEAAEAFQYMAMAGWDVDSMMGGISGVMNLAAASGEDLASVSDIVTDAMTAFGLSADSTSKVLKDGIEIEVDNTTRFVDALAAASNSSNTNVAMLGESFKYVAPVAGSLGYSIEDTAIALGLMANQGIKASQSGTALRTILTNMAKPSDEVANAMDALGVSLEDDNGRVKSLMEVMGDLRDGFGGGRIGAEEFSKQMQELQTAFDEGDVSAAEYELGVENLMVAMYGVEGAQKAQYAAMLAGKTGMAGLLAIVSTGEKDFNKLSDSIYNASGTSQTMADIMNDNLSGQIKIMVSALQELAIQFGEVLLPVVKDVVEWLQDMVAKFQELSPEQKEQIVKWVAIAAAVGPVLMVLGKITSSVGSVISIFGKLPGAISKAKTGFGTLNTALVNVKEGFTLAKAGFPGLGAEASKLGAIFAGISAPMVIAVGAIVALIGTLVAAFKHLWDTNEEFRASIIAIWDGIKAKFDAFGQAFVERINALGFDFTSLTDALSAAWDGFCNMLAPVFETAFNIVSIILGGILDILIGLLDVFIGLFTGNWEQVWTGVKEIFTGQWDEIIDTFGGAIDSIKNGASAALDWFITNWQEGWQAIKDFFIAIWEAIKTFFINIMNGIKTFASNAWNELKAIITNVVNAIKSAVSQAFEMMKTSVSNITSGIKTFVINTFNNIKSSVTGIADNIKSSVSQKFESLKTSMSSSMSSAKSNVINAMTEAKNGVVRVWDGITDTFADIGRNIIQGLINGIGSMVGKLYDSIKSALSNLVDDAKDELDIESPSGVFRDEVGKWIPPGIAEGFVSAMGNAAKVMRKSFNDGMNSLNADNVRVGIKDNMISVASQVAGYFESIESRLADAVAGMKSSLEYLIAAGTAAANGVLLGYVGHRGTNNTDGDNDKPGNNDPRGNGGNTYVFYTTKAIDEIEAAKQMKRAERDMAEGFA